MEEKKTPYTDSLRKKLALKAEAERHKFDLINKVLPKEVKKIAPKKQENIIKKIEKEPEKIIKEVKEILTTKKARRVERYVIFAIYLIVFLIAGYFFVVNLHPEVLPDNFYTYEVSASDSLITSNLRSLYLKEGDALGRVTEINNESARIIVAEKPFNFIFNPKRKVEENTTAEIQLEFINPSTEIYLNENLIIPDLDGYEKVADFSDEEVWVKEELARLNYNEEGNAEDFIYANFPGKNIYSFGEVSGGVPIIPDYKKTPTYIETQFRDNLKLAVYNEGTLRVEFTKQDINAYVGKDEYTVEITDLKGNSYFNKTYGDDGDKKDSNKKGIEQAIIINGMDLPRGIYYVTFTKDQNNKASDSTIKNIIVNSNKVLIIGNFLPLEKFEFYTEVSSPETIGFNFWHNGKEQKIKQTGTSEETINLDASWFNKKYEQNLTNGEYSFEIPKGDLWIYSKEVSSSKENWFYLPKEGDKKLIGSDVLIIDKNKLKINGSDVNYTEIINLTKESKIKIQVLDGLKTYFKKIKLVL